MRLTIENLDERVRAIEALLATFLQASAIPGSSALIERGEAEKSRLDAVSAEKIAPGFDSGAVER